MWKSKSKVAVLFVLIIMITGVFAACSGKDNRKKYTVFFGLNDATTEKQELQLEDAKEQLRALWIENDLGYTEYVAYGAYTEDGKVKGNDTIVYELCFVEKAAVEAAVKQAKEQLNLDSVLISEQEANYYFSE